MTTPKRLFIIDAMSLAFRSFYALGRSSLSTHKGLPTGAIYGSALFMQKLLNEQRPDLLLAVTDTPEPTFRHKLFTNYKATRSAMPDDLSQQIPHIFKLLELYRCPLLKIPGVEADDVIGTVAKRYAGPDLKVFIVAGDKDFMQVIDDHIVMYVPKKNEEAVIVDRAGVFEKFHCSPAQVVDALALIGDTVDNVPGVHGIGEKGAAKLIETFGSLDGIYANLDKIAGKKQRESLEASRADAYLSRDLVTLKTDIELPLTLEQMNCDWPTAAANPELLDFFKELEFRSLVTKVTAAISAQTPGASRAATKPTQAEPVDVVTPEIEGDPRVEPEDPAVPPVQVIDEASLAQLNAAVATAEKFSFVLVASGTDILADKGTILALVTGGGERFDIPLSEMGVYYLRPLLNGPKIKVGHGVKYATEMLLNLGLELNAPCVDLEICDYLLEPNHYNHSLESMAERYLGKALSTVPSAVAATISALHDQLFPRIVNLGLLPVLTTIEMPLIPVLAAMERTGFYIDAEYLDSFSSELDGLAKKLEAELYAAAGSPFNINSSKQLQGLLFDKLKLQEAAGIKRLKTTKTGFSTDESVLAQLASVHPVPDLIIKYRNVMKLKNTYVDPLPQYINPRSRRVHTTFNQTVAATGRLSSDNPNLQNIPIQSALGKRIRQAFTAEGPDSVLISADYSQVEIRLLAHLAKATDLIEAFKQGLDVHTVTAAKIFNVSESAVTPELRSRAKAVNFGIIYGMGPQRLAANTGVTLAEAKAFIGRYFEVYPGIKAYTEGLIESARRTGYCVTMFGRRRPIPEMRDANQSMQVRGENIAVNAPIQGSAADLIKLAMIRVHAALLAGRFKTRMLLQVHDELVFSAPSGETGAVVPIIRDSMEHAIEASVPLKVDIHWGVNWLAAH